MAKIFNRPILIGGEKRRIDGVSFRVLEYDSNNNIARATCESTPTGVTGRGFAKMAEVLDRENKKTYKNKGTESTASFVESAKGDTGATGPTGATGDTGPVDVETVTLNFTATSTGDTGTITTGSTPIGFIVSEMTSTGATYPAASHLELSTTGTTLTGRLSAEPGEGTALAFEVTLKKA
jgi:hypothetical protein